MRQKSTGSEKSSTCPEKPFVLGSKAWEKISAVEKVNPMKTYLTDQTKDNCQYVANYYNCGSEERVCDCEEIHGTYNCRYNKY